MSERMASTCRFCGKEGEGTSFEQWVKPTFTDWDKLLPGDIICDACAFWFNEASIDLARIAGKEKPQRMRNYSHFIVSGEWMPLSKGDKARMRVLLLHAPFPELAVIAESGQKHIAFRATRNEPGAASGWVQFEEQRVWVDPSALAEQLLVVEQLYAAFSKTEIATGEYKSNCVLKFGPARWWELEQIVRSWRGSPLFDLTIFLAQRSEENGSTETRRGDVADGHLENDPSSIQEQISDEHLGAVRERGAERSLHEQPGQIRQLDLFAP